MKHRLAKSIVPAILASLVAVPALAHPGHEITGMPLLSGLQHPLTGFDHLLAMSALGLWAGMGDTRHPGSWLAVFAAALVAGFASGISGLHVPFVESVILVSVLAGGMLVGLAVKANPLVIGSIIGFFAFFHGAAHGMEAPVDGHLLFLAGFLPASMGLATAGYFAGRGLKRAEGRPVVGLIGAAVVAAGAVMGFSQ